MSVNEAADVMHFLVDGYLRRAAAEDGAPVGMASSSVLLLQLLFMVSAASAWYHSYFGGSVTFSPKGKNSDGTYEVSFKRL